MKRRNFLQVSALAGGGLMLGLVPEREAAADEAFAPNAYISIDSAGLVTLLAKNPDMGQGVKTSLPMLLAEELDVDFARVRVLQAGANARMADQGSGGSQSVPQSWDQLRRAGAAARQMLMLAAAERWGVAVAELSTDKGQVLHAPSGRRAGYGELAAAAARLKAPDPAGLKLKPRAEFKLLGRRVAQVDSAEIVRGTSLFCGDTQRPGLLHAVIAKSPVFGAKPLSANLEQIKAMAGVRDAFLVEGDADALRPIPQDRPFRSLQPFVAIVATSTWAALKAKQALKVQWDDNAYKQHSSAAYRATALQRLAESGELWRDDGDVPGELARAAKLVEATYELPILAHTTMEPMSCFAEPTLEGGLRLIAPCQFPGIAVLAVQAVLGVPAAKVEVQIARLGGGFGRRFESDFVLEAGTIAQRMKAPIQLMYTREDDMRHDFYRPFGWQRLRGGLDAQGRLQALHVKHARHAFRDPVTPKLRASLYPARFVPNYRVEVAMVDSNLPAGAYRAPGSNLNAFMLESFTDELAHAAGQDPLAFRLALLGEDRELKEPDFSPTRMKGVLRLAAEKAGWGRKLPRGSGMGLAAYFSHGGYIAHVVELSVSRTGGVAVQRVTSAVDVGPIVNLSGAEQQVQGSVIDGLSSSLWQEITVENGAVVQGSFDDNPHLRMPEVPPRIDVHFIQRDMAPTGLGEPAFPPLPPALGNAIFAATGKRVRSLPLRKHDLSWS
ncbi:xanthine dehydrogenase family protein molybdopterin-binding subunit [Roseateles toxinivorans]|uniref:Isoquinoline 1-oxidoreductase beta subunit n=1 Tax=Roseateles toxinivorans TaxID=270368 RepID=A0A4R6QC54_9BURK|nr:molybdopterin cofactor-binding domain-containing protein [Roseateles toxinivorans]TDP58919.1 isoquinoline 1-oxidoreductase beta subunit [Roseateles toxinivorans]